MEALHERFVKDIHQAIEHVFVLREFIVRYKWNQTKHDQNPLSMSRQRPCAGWYLLVVSSGTVCLESRHLLGVPVPFRSPFPLDIYRITLKGQKVNRSNNFLTFILCGVPTMLLRKCKMP